MRSVNIQEARQKLSDLINAAEHGQSVLITRHGKEVARLEPAGQAGGGPLPDLSAFRESIRSGLREKGKPLSKAVTKARREAVLMGYLDTSVLAAYYCPEPLSRKVQRTLSELSEPTISPLVELELRSALAMKVRGRKMDAATAEKITAMFQVHLADGRYRIVPIGSREYTLGRNWLGGFNSPLRTLDALHLAAAFANDLTLISADKPLIRCARQFGVKHQLVA